MRDQNRLRRIRAWLFVSACVLFMAAVPSQAAAQTQSQIRETMDTAFSNGEDEVVLTLDRTFSVNEYEAKQEAENYAQELMTLLEEVALENGRLMNGTSYSYTIHAAQTVVYRFDISEQFTKKVKLLTSEKNAYKQALKALKKHDYTTAFYAEGAMYYETFVLALQHHPEYNYNLVIWKSTDGTCGYRAGGDLSESQMLAKMRQADKKASAIIRKIIRADMTKKQKLAAIHDYLVKNCVYNEKVYTDDYNDAYTAYGCLVKKTAVCQGYAAAFNLLATKAGICSISAIGEAGGGSHAWNYVKCGSSYRYIDVTWDDPIPDRGAKAKVSRKYFYVTEKKLDRTHTWDKVENAKKYVDYAAVL